MNNEQSKSLRDLLASRATAALGTLHDGAPYVSMVPFAMLPDGAGFVIHVSRLAAHTNDMLVDPRVSLLIAAAERTGTPPQSLARVTILGTARQLTDDSPEGQVARQKYLARFPDAAPLFRLGDFSLFLIVPGEARWVAGFAQARTLSAAAFARVFKQSSD